MTIAEFIAKWRKVELKERSAAQEHFLDLCRVFNHPTPAAADPTGESFCFEKGTAKHGGGDGFADVWKRGFFGWEYKGKHKDLAAAFDQLLRYRDALENPPLLVLCDLDRIVVRTNFTGTVSAVHEIPLEALSEPRTIEIMRAVFHNPESLRPGRTSAAVTQEAAVRIGEIAAAMRERGLDPAAVAHFLDRIVFCLFAEDTRLLPDMVFSRMLEKAGGDPARFGKTLAMLFEVMATGGDFGLETIRHFNGSLFDDPPSPDGYGATRRTPIPVLGPDDVKRIATAATLDWSAVDPSIFGTLFERGLDPAKRAQLGAHFTGMADIELVVNAVVISPLRREWEETRGIIESLLATGKKNPGSAGVPPASSSKAPREWHSRGYLPHFDHPGLVQTVTFRLADSLPAHLLERLRVRSEKTDDPALRQEIEEALDASHGACHLRDPRVAAVVQNALLHFDAERYNLLAWAVMPNHVHIMMETLSGHRLDDILHSWKSFTAHECNRLLKRTGTFWQEEYYDRFIRDGAHLRKALEYIEQNPVKAGLCKRAEEWVFGNAGYRGRPGGTPALPLRAGGTPALLGSALTPAKLRKARGEASAILHQFLTRLHGVKILDPACGSGNFLYVALLRLKDLEKEAILFGADNDLGAYLPGVGPWQLYGIEINPYAHDLAQMTVWIGWLQWIRANGFGFPADPILRPLADNIRLMDAIITPDGSEPDWPKVDFIIGNPPFLGDKMMRRELGDAYVDRLRALYSNRIPGQSDLCCYWFEKARAHITAGKCKRAGLLATQGIRGGANREVLKRIKDSGNIFWAESDRPWILDGANVHVSMVGFDDGEEATYILDGNSVATINANLTDAANLATTRPLPGNRALCFLGIMKAGPFDIAEAVALEWLNTPNPNGRPSSDVLRPRMNAMDILRRSGGGWIVDFGCDSEAAEVALYERPFDHVLNEVKPLRDANRRKSLKVYWWLHGEPRPGLRKATDGLSRCVLTPEVSKHRIFVWLDSVFLADHQTRVFARSDDYFFGVLHSRFHEVWALKLGTRLETRPRYTPTTCFETFPFPEGHAERDASISDAAKELNELRERWLNPPEWTRTETLEFPGTVGGPWDRYIVPGSSAVPAASGSGRDARAPVGTVRYPRLVPRDAACAERLKARTLTKLYNERPAWLADCHAKLDAAVAAAYGWPADLTDEAILERLLKLNQAVDGGKKVCSRH